MENQKGMESMTIDQTCLIVLLDFPPIGGPPVSDLEDDTTGERSASESLNWTAGSCALKLKSKHLTTFYRCRANDNFHVIHFTWRVVYLK